VGRLFFNCWFLLGMITSVAVQAQAHTNSDVIEVRAEAWTGYSEAGDGYLFKLIKAVYEPLGYKVVYKFCPWKRCMQDVIEGSGDILLTLYGDEPYVDKYLRVNQHPVYIERIGVAYKASRWPEWQGEKMLEGHKLGFIRGYELDKELNVPVRFMEATNSKQLWRLLMAGRIDFIIDGTTPLENDKSLYVPNKKDFVISPVFRKPAYFGFSINKRGELLADLFNQRQLVLYRSGEIKSLLKEHGLEWMKTLRPERP